MCEEPVLPLLRRWSRRGVLDPIRCERVCLRRQRCLVCDGSHTLRHVWAAEQPQPQEHPQHETRSH